MAVRNFAQTEIFEQQGDSIIPLLFVPYHRPPIRYHILILGVDYIISSLGCFSGATKHIITKLDITQKVYDKQQL